MNTVTSRILIGTMLTALSVAAHASADCPRAAGGTELGKEALRARLEAQGYKVKRMEKERGCYEVKAQDKSGKTVELQVSAADGSVTEEDED